MEQVLLSQPGKRHRCMPLPCQLECAAPAAGLFLGAAMRGYVHGFMRGQEGVLLRHDCDFRRLPRGKWCPWVLGVQRPFNGFLLVVMGWQCVLAERGQFCVQVDRPRANGAKIDQPGGLGQRARSITWCRWAENGSLVQAGPAKTVTGCARRGFCKVRQRRGHKGSGVGAPRWAG